MAGAFVEFVKNAEKLGKKKGRLPILSSYRFFPFKEERELISLVRSEFERAMNANIELAFNWETFADSLEEMNNNESALPSTFVEKSRTIAKSVDSNARSSFSKQSEMIIGHPYFPPENARQIIETWHSNFLELCKSAENDTKAEISRIVATAQMQGWNKKQVETAIKEKLPSKTKHRAELIARTETGKLNSSVVMETMKSVGIRYYKWLATLDTRCRASHTAMNNVICSLDDPTIFFEDNPENGAKPIKHNRTADMVKLHPGFDFQCRCSMVMWEPEIDSKYKVKEEHITEPPHIESNNVNIANLNSMNSESIHEAEKFLLKSKISENDINKIIKKRRKEKVKAKGVLTKKIENLNDVQGVLNKLGKQNSFFDNIKLKTFNDSYDEKNNSYTAMKAEHDSREIFLNEVIVPGMYSELKSPSLYVIDAFENIRQGRKLTFDEEYMIETLYHEILHLAAKKWKPLKKGSSQCLAMETMNQFVSRHHYGELIEAVGGELYHQKMVITNGKSYSKYLKRLNSIKSTKSEKIKREFKQTLLTTDYSKLELWLNDFLEKNGGSLQRLLSNEPQ